MKNLLKHPAVYQLYQELGGFFAARVRAIQSAQIENAANASASASRA